MKLNDVDMERIGVITTTQGILQFPENRNRVPERKWVKIPTHIIKLFLLSN
jgi:hypothetical protein